MEKVFPYVEIITKKLDAEVRKRVRSTFVVIAGKSPLDLTGLDREYPLVDTAGRSYAVEVLSGGEKAVLRRKAGGRIFTDDHAPVENLLAPVYRASVLNNMSDYYYARGEALFQEKMFAEAARFYRKAGRIDPLCAEAWFRLGVIALQERRLDEAESFFRRAVSIEPYFDRAFNNLGLVLLLRGDAFGAFSHFETVLRLRPDSAPAMNNLGMFYAGKGESKKAVQWFRMALQARPGYAVSAGNLELIRTSARTAPHEPVRLPLRYAVAY